MISKPADSLTNMILTSPDGTLVAGQAFQDETFIHIQWLWISLPVPVVFSVNLLLAIMIVQTWRRRAPVGKNSALALRLHGLKVDSGNTGNVAATSLSEMELLAEQKRVKLNGRDVQDLRFICA